MFSRKAEQTPYTETPCEPFQRTRKQSNSSALKIAFEYSRRKGSGIKHYRRNKNCNFQIRATCTGWRAERRWQGFKIKVTEEHVTRWSPLHRYSVTSVAFIIPEINPSLLFSEKKGSLNKSGFLNVNIFKQQISVNLSNTFKYPVLQKT